MKQYDKLTLFVTKLDLVYFVHNLF